MNKQRELNKALAYQRENAEVKEVPDCEFQMYVPLVRTAPNLAPVLEKLKVAPSIFGATFLSVSSTLTSLRQKEEGLLKSVKTFTTNNIRNIKNFITSTLKSLAIRAIWLALSSVIYS